MSLMISTKEGKNGEQAHGKGISEIFFIPVPFFIIYVTSLSG
jgi:hypothetical protein